MGLLTSIGIWACLGALAVTSALSIVLAIIIAWGTFKDRP